VILIGIIAALVLRIFFALVVTQLMQIVGLIFAGGLLLLWVSWKMWRELQHSGASRTARPRSRATSIAASSPPRASPAPPGRSPSPTSR
jgi:predicted tellurium resistance membrane protein TerC